MPPSTNCTRWPSARWAAGSWSEIDSTTSLADIDRTATTVPDPRRVLGHERLDDERPARGQAGGDGGEAGRLALGALQVEQRVVGDERDVERAGRQVVDHVAEHDR